MKAKTKDEIVQEFADKPQNMTYMRNVIEHHLTNSEVETTDGTISKIKYNKIHSKQE